MVLWPFNKNKDSEEEDDELSERVRIQMQSEKDALALMDESLESIQKSINDLAAEVRMLRNFAGYLPQNNIAHLELIRAADSIKKTAGRIAQAKLKILTVRGFLKGQFK